MDYSTIKATAKAEGCSVKDLLALSAGNDPFYVGSPGQMEKAQWFAKIYKEMGSPSECHCRRVHYWMTTSTIPKPDGSRYLNTVKDWGLMTICAKYARYAGLVPVDNIIDRRNPPPIVNSHFWEDDNPTEIKEATDADEIIRSIVNKFYCYNPTNTQQYMIELWCEKSTMNDVLEPICSKHGINLVTGLGELSITAVNNLVERVMESDKPVRIFYISDFDPAGECMPVSVARKIEYLVKDENVTHDIKLKPIMLTADQCKRYQLPRTPIKSTERRKEGFENRYGTGATELDALEALHPGEMKKLITSSIAPYFDRAAWNQAIDLNNKVKAKVNDFISDKIGNVLEELDVEEFDNVQIEKKDLADDDDDSWLYDSDLDYEQQMIKYKRHQGK